jgi:hypothetical protein
LNALSVSRFTAWAPGISDDAAWKEWAVGTRDAAVSRDSPALEFTDALFRRRLSQISRMTIQVLRDLLPLGEQSKVVFVSFWGEVTRQCDINRTLIEEGTLTPAAFSRSVFNAPPALAAIALKLRGGYSAVYPSVEHFDAGFLAAAASFESPSTEEVALVYADECWPSDYVKLGRAEPPLAFAALLVRGAQGIPVNENVPLTSPAAFLRYLWLHHD